MAVLYADVAQTGTEHDGTQANPYSLADVFTLGSANPGDVILVRKNGGTAPTSPQLIQTQQSESALITIRAVADDWEGRCDPFQIGTILQLASSCLAFENIQIGLFMAYSGSTASCHGIYFLDCVGASSGCGIVATTNPLAGTMEWHFVGCDLEVGSGFNMTGLTGIYMFATALRGGSLSIIPLPACFAANCLFSRTGGMELRIESDEYTTSFEGCVFHHGSIHVLDAGPKIVPITNCVVSHEGKTSGTGYFVRGDDSGSLPHSIVSRGNVYHSLDSGFVGQRAVLTSGATAGGTPATNEAVPFSANPFRNIAGGDLSLVRSLWSRNSAYPSHVWETPFSMPLGLGPRIVDDQDIGIPGVQ